MMVSYMVYMKLDIEPFMIRQSHKPNDIKVNKKNNY